jgi:hypothetical protein
MSHSSLRGISASLYQVESSAYPRSIKQKEGIKMIKYNFHKSFEICFLVGALLIVGLTSGVSASQSISCEDLLNLRKGGVTITLAEIVPAAGTLPDRCKLRGFLDDEVNFEINLPTEWNGKFYMAGIGGYAGSITAQTNGLSRGYATTATDTGHQASSFDASWGLDDMKAKINWYFLANHRVAVAAKTIIEDYYGKKIAHSYFEGC